MKKNALGFYHAMAQPKYFSPTLETDIDTKILVIGGGFAGLNSAIGLAERGERDVVLIESESVAYGASGRNGGFVFAGYSLGEASLLKQLGAPKAKRVYQATIDAIELIRRRITWYKIDCDLVDHGVIWANWFRDQNIIKQRQQLLAQYFDVHWDFLDQPQMQQQINSARYFSGAWERNALHLNPLNYAQGLAQACISAGIKIFTQTRAISLTQAGHTWTVEVENRDTKKRIKINAEHVILSCGGYLAGLDQKIDRSILPIATYVMVTEPLGKGIKDLFPNTNVAVYDTRFAFDYYRPLHDTRLLWGGRISVLDRAPNEVARLLKRDVQKVFPQLKDIRIAQAWSGLMSYARHEMPQIMQLKKNLWCAQGFGGHGLSSTCAAGEILADAITRNGQSIQDYLTYGLDSAHKPVGFAAAQLKYWFLQLQDRWRD